MLQLAILTDDLNQSHFPFHLCCFLWTPGDTCLRCKRSVPGIVPAFCLLLHRLNFVKFVTEHSLIMLLNFIFPDDSLASPLGVRIWLKCGSLLWTAHWGRASLAAGKGEYTLGSEQCPCLQVSEVVQINCECVSWSECMSAMFMSPHPGNEQDLSLLVSVCQLKQWL